MGDGRTVALGERIPGGSKNHSTYGVCSDGQQVVVKIQAAHGHLPREEIASRTVAGEVAACGYRRWRNNVAHLSVLTDSAHRQRGHARRAAAAAIRHALTDGLLPQRRARPVASQAVARRTGLVAYGAQPSLEWSGGCLGEEVSMRGPSGPASVAERTDSPGELVSEDLVVVGVAGDDTEGDAQLGQGDQGVEPAPVEVPVGVE